MRHIWAGSFFTTMWKRMTKSLLSQSFSYRKLLHMSTFYTCGTKRRRLAKSSIPCAWTEFYLIWWFREWEMKNSSFRRNDWYICMKYIWEIWRVSFSRGQGLLMPAGREGKLSKLILLQLRKLSKTGSDGNVLINTTHCIFLHLGLHSWPGRLPSLNSDPCESTNRTGTGGSGRWPDLMSHVCFYIIWKTEEHMERVFKRRWWHALDTMSRISYISV